MPQTRVLEVLGTVELGSNMQDVLDNIKLDGKEATLDEIMNLSPLSDNFIVRYDDKEMKVTRWINTGKQFALSAAGFTIDGMELNTVESVVIDINTNSEEGGITYSEV